MNYYELLQVTPSASAEVIKNAYKAMAKKYHPDLYQGNRAFAEEKMKLLNEAISILESEEKRREYNIENNFPDVSDGGEQNDEYMKDIDEFLNYSDSRTPPDVAEMVSFGGSGEERGRSLFDYEEELEKVKSPGRKRKARIGKWYYIVIAGLVLANIVIIALIIGNFSTTLLNSFLKKDGSEAGGAVIGDDDDIQDYIAPNDWNDDWEDEISAGDDVPAFAPTQDFAETYTAEGNETAAAEPTTEKTAMTLPPTAATTGKKLPAPAASKTEPPTTAEPEKITEPETVPEYAVPEETTEEESSGEAEFPYGVEQTTADYLQEVAPGMITEEPSEETAESEAEHDPGDGETADQIE